MCKKAENNDNNVRRHVKPYPVWLGFDFQDATLPSGQEQSLHLESVANNCGWAGSWLPLLCAQ